MNRLCDWCNEMQPKYDDGVSKNGYNYCEICSDPENDLSQWAMDTINNKNKKIIELVKQNEKLKKFRQNMIQFNGIELCDDCGEIVGSDCECDSCDGDSIDSVDDDDPNYTIYNYSDDDDEKPIDCDICGKNIDNRNIDYVDLCGDGKHRCDICEKIACDLPQ